MTDTSRAMLLFGTDEPVVPIRTVRAGRLMAMIDRGNVRYVSWDGVEVLRAISFVVRDSNWGTYAPALDGFVVEEGQDRFEIRYAAACDGPEGDFSFEARIVGSADGTLSFVAGGRSSRGFRTNRTGFVVLHGLDGVVGKAVEVEHAGGGRSATVFPKLISGSQPIFDISALTHEPRPGLSVTVRMEGDAFEMEDQRNWTDASFKTYVRPLARGYPYEIAPGEVVEQSVSVRMVERALPGLPSSPAAPSPAPTQSVIPAKAGTHIPEASTATTTVPPPESMGPGFRRDDGRWGSKAGRHVAVTIGTEAGVMPMIGLALDPAIPLDVAALGRWAVPNYLVARIDARGPDSSSLSPLGGESRRGGLWLGRTDLSGISSAERPPPNPPPQGERAKEEPDLIGLRAFCEQTGVVLDLDILVDSESATAELQALASVLSTVGATPAHVLPLPTGVDTYAAIRTAFPQSLVAAGTVVGFPELNRNRPPPGFDVIAHSTQAIVHAADDLSVMETLEALPDVIATARSFAPNARYRIGPATIGAPAAFYAATPAANTTGSRMAAAEPDPRQQGLVAAAFALGYAATVAAEAVDAVTLSIAEGPHGIGAATPYPIAAIVDGLARLAGRPRLDTAVSGKGIAALAAATEAGTELWLANLTGERLTVAIENGRFASIRRIDAAALADHPVSGIGFARYEGSPVELDAHAVACLRQVDQVIT